MKNGTYSDQHGFLGEVFFHHLNSFIPLIAFSCELIEHISETIPHAVDIALHCLSLWRDFFGLSPIVPLHSRQYCTFLVVLTRRLHVVGYYRESDIVAYLNKSLNGCEIFGHVTLPLNFLLGHTLGIVPGKAKYGNNIIIQHGVTVGGWRGESPRIGNHACILNGALIASASILGDNSMVAPGVRVVNQVVPESMVAFQG